MVSLTAVVWLAIAAWLFVAIFAWAAIRVASRFDNPPKTVRKPRISKARRDDEV